MTEHSLTTGEKLPIATQSSPEMLQPLDVMVRVLLVSRYLFALLGLAFFLWEGVEVFWMNEDLTWAVIEVALISVLGPVLVWVSSGWVLRLARDASRTHRQIQHEIAERRRAQDELEESGERFRRLVENAWDAFFLHDLDGRFVDVNQRACDSLGYMREELLALSVPDVELNFAQDRIGDSWGQMIPKTPVTREGIHKRRDGTAFPVEVRSGLLESGGRPLFLALARDVTERKRAEEALRESEERYRTLFEQSRDAIVITCEDEVRDLNQAALDLFGYSRGEALKLAIPDLYVDLAERERLWRELSDNGSVEDFEVRFRKRDGTEMDCLATITLREDKEGGGMGVQGIIRDVTEHKRAEEALRKSEDEALRMAQENAVLAEIGRIVNSSLNLNTVYESIAEQVHDLILFDRISIATADLETGVLVPEYVAGIELPVWRTGDVVPLSESSSRTTIKTKKPQFIGSGPEAESRGWPLGEQLAYKAGLRSGISVPIVYNDEVIGDFILRSTKQDAYSQRELLLADRIATQIANAIANARLHGHLQREADEREVMAEIGRIIGSTLEIDQVYERFADQVRKLISFDRMMISAIDLDQGTFTELHVSGHDVPERGVGVVVPLAGTATREVMKRRSALLVQGAAEQTLREQYPGMAPGLRAGFRSFLSVPLLAKDEVVGVFHLRSAEPNAYSQADLKLAERVATQIAGTIANAQLHAAIQHEGAEREVLAEISRIIGSSLDISEVYASFAEQVRKIIPFDRISITTIDVKAGTLTHPYVAGIEVRGWEPGIVLPLAGSATEMLVRTRSHLLIGEDGIEEVINRFPCIAAGFDGELPSMLAVPLISNNIVLGTLQFRSRSPNEYSERELALAERVANQIAGTIANAQLHAAIRREAEERAILAEIGRIISSTLDIDQVYERFADQVRKLIPFDRIVISRIDVERDAVTPAYISGFEVPGLGVDRVFPLPGTADDMMVRTRSSVVDDAESPEAFAARFPTLAPTIAAGLRSLLAVRLISNDELIGTMILRSTSPSAYAAPEVAMAERVANQIAGAIANAQLHGDLKRVEEALRESEHRIKELAADTVRAHEEERQWSAIEVHDRISQPLAGLFHELESLESITVADSQPREMVRRASVLLQEAIRECRNIMDALYPAGLDEFGLVALLDAELGLFEQDTGCRAQLDNNLSVSVPKDIGVALYRIFHEALNNIRRHAASANSVIVSVAYEAQALSLYIQDDGPGFDVEAAMDGQRVSGLISMSRRAEIIGGTCEIESAPGQGTAVKIHVPTDARNL